MNTELYVHSGRDWRKIADEINGESDGKTRHSATGPEDEEDDDDEGSPIL